MDETKKINIILLVLFILLIVATVTFFVFPSKAKNQYVYNGFVVSKFRLESAPNLVFHYIDLNVGNNKYEIPIRNDPRTLENIVVEINDVGWLKKSLEADNYNILAKQVYMTFNPDLSNGDLLIAGGEIVRVLGSGDGGIYHLPVTGTFTKQIEGSETIVKTCNDASLENAVIMLDIGEENKIYNNKNCIVLEGKDYTNLIRVADRFLLKLVGVMP